MRLTRLAFYRCIGIAVDEIAAIGLQLAFRRKGTYAALRNVGMKLRKGAETTAVAAAAADAAAAAAAAAVYV